MASQALYRRYRSQTFDELVGQEHIVQTLRNALAEGRIAHAYLFTGPRGVGKTTVARLLSKAVNCTAEMAERPCGECEMCVAIAEGRAVDVIEMDAASHTSVEDAREIIERVQFRPTLGRYKVYIIDETHMLSTAAFNALLKTLEEPPGHALFILATTEIHKVPATITSRCQRFTFNRHSISAMTAHLRMIAEQEGFTLQPGAGEAIGRASTGSMRDALSLLDQLMAYGSHSITVEQVRSLLGTSETQEVTQLIDTLISNDLTGALHAVAAVATRGGDLRQFTRDLVERLRALMLIKATADSTLLDLSEDDLVAFQAQAAATQLTELLAWTRLFGELDTQLRTSPYGQLPLELAVVEALTGAPARTVAVPQRPAVAAQPAPPVRPPAEARPVARPPEPVAVVQPKPARPPEPVVHAIAEPAEPAETVDVAQQRPAAVEPSVPEHGTAPTHLPAAVPADAEVEAANAAVAQLEQVEGIWPDVIRDVRVHDKTLQALLNSGVRPVDVSGSIVTLEASNDWLLGRLERPQVRQIIERVISKHMGSPYIVQCVVETQRQENTNALREQIRVSRKDPIVKAAINIFDADIVRVEAHEE